MVTSICIEAQHPGLCLAYVQANMVELVMCCTDDAVSLHSYMPVSKCMTATCAYDC